MWQLFYLESTILIDSALFFLSQKYYNIENNFDNPRKGYETMAKLNKYWGLVALGAATAAAAGAIAAFMTKKSPRREILDYEDDFDEDFDTLSEDEDEEEEKAAEDFVAWDDSDETQEDAAPEEASEEEAEEKEETASEEEVPKEASQPENVKPEE